jgi:cytochrome c oxidase subunit 2
MNGMIAQFGDSFWMPTPSSTFAKDVDWLFYFILAICTFFFSLIVVVMVLFIVRYRRREGHEAVKTATHNYALEVTWSIIPLILVFVIFGLGLRGFMDMTTPSANAYEVGVTAFKWGWAFTYPNGHVDANLHVPVDRPVKLVLSSQDVIHSFFVPAFRIKKDLVPGRYHTTWFQATEVNDEPGYDIFCAEYCGTGHSTMLAKCYVHEPSAFKAWLEEAANWENRMSPADRGEDLYTSRGCVQCHSLDGTRVIGPTFKALWDRTVDGTTVFQDGTKLEDLLVDNYTPETYLRESIYEPGKHVVAGYDNVMASYQGQLKDNDVMAMIAFFKTLSDKYKPDPSDLEIPAESETTTATAPGDPETAETQTADGDNDSNASDDTTYSTTDSETESNQN